MDFAVPTDHRVKLKGSEKKDKYLDLARELKKLWNIKVTVIQIVIGALGTGTKFLLKELEDLEIEDMWKSSKLQHCWDRLEYWEESRRPKESWYHSDSSEKPPANAGMKNSQKSKMIIKWTREELRQMDQKIGYYVQGFMSER